ncbi:MAG: metal-dependent hydrolase [Winogradskyella sp.]|uniref:metal-dependent hydrolase n=1 Tax=Winogradskyella sp. TaxID=1883156 RepID=UPI0017E79583|nr:metal-dependent hydrolase [Winogradskyella sp.]MBT8245091.1 metal-dependent hydrolase [Winogradskyella sp.]NNK22866.1 metal-dependent hydrolase [Winogradskyella sp.]
MDSLTQIVLGAACGEAVLGKKIGNKALLFGAIGGTIPDLDVFVGALFYGNEIQAMAFHRGFMHSILFAILGAIVFGWLVFKLYDKGKRWHTTNLKDWVLLFFLALFTHPILDCFTPYGTQLFSPFSDYRVAFNTIAVVDPLYTLPFLISLIVLMFFKRTKPKRQLWLKLGVVISSVYLVLTVFNKYYVNWVYKNSLVKNNIAFKRFQTQPTIFNNVLWYGVAETETEYYVGFYSLLDNKKVINDWTKIDKQQHLIPMNDRDLSKLAWFSDRYYSIRPSENKDKFIYSDLRYPLLDPNDAKTSLFTFRVFNNNGRWDIKNSRPEINEDASLESVFGPMIKRLKGK